MGVIYILSDKKIHNSTSLSLITQEYFDIKLDLQNYDVIISTSRKTVEFLQNYNLSHIKHLALKNQNADTFIAEILPLIKNKRVIYPRAKKIVSNIIEIMKNNKINFHDVIIYETKCSKSNIKIKLNSAIIFSSPSTIECFFANYKWHSSYIAIVIGETTAQYMPKDLEYFIPSVSSLESCVDLAKEKILLK